MGYSKTPITVRKVQPLLDEMVKSDKSIEWIFEDPQKVCYKIYEAIKYSIRSGKKEFEEYSSLLNKYKLKPIEPNIVKAEIRAVPILPHGTVVREINDVLGVIGAAIEYKKDRLFFPDFKQDEAHDDLDTLKHWCSNNNYYCFFNDSILELKKVS